MASMPLLDISMPDQSSKNSNSVSESTHADELLEWVSCCDDEEEDFEIAASCTSEHVIPDDVQQVSNEERVSRDKFKDTLDKLAAASFLSMSTLSTSERPSAQPSQVPLPQFCGSVIACRNLQDWQEIPVHDCAGLRVSRAWSHDRFQSIVDWIQQSGKVPESGLGETVKPGSSFQAAITKLLGKLALPVELEAIEMEKQLIEDACAIGEQMLELLHDVKTFEVKLEVMGKNVCRRWHSDYYVWRALVAYNCMGTEYTESANVDFWELENCGNNECVILDKSKIMQTDVGDIFMMKGSGFPKRNRQGLVHKSPEPRSNADGSVIPRLLFKIDGFVDSP